MFTERRSIRRYKDMEVDEDVINFILEAARWAPSWANTQCCELIVIRNSETKKQLSQVLSPKNPATLAVQNAPIVIAVCGSLEKSGFYSNKPMTKFGDWFMYDLGLATENICLAAHHMGLGTVIVGLFDHDKAAAILGVPGSHAVVALLPLGYADHEPPAPKRKAIEEFVHYENFSGK